MYILSTSNYMLIAHLDLQCTMIAANKIGLQEKVISMENGNSVFFVFREG